MKTCKKIGKYLSALNYTKKEFTESILFPLLSWLKEEEYSREEAGIIITKVVNVKDEVIEDYYNPNTHSDVFTDKSDLLKILSQEEFEKLEKLIRNKRRINKSKYKLNEDEFVEVDFLNHCVKHVQVVHKKDGSEDVVDDVIIEAAPTELIIYDNDMLDDGRRFKITWKSKYSPRAFVTKGETGGATIKEIGAQLVNSGYCPQSKLVNDTLSFMINAMISDQLAIIKDSIDNTGVYYYDDKIQVVNLDTSKPTVKEVQEALEVLDKLQSYYGEEEKTILATVVKWGACSVFSYPKKQKGANWMPHLYLTGTGQAGKTTMAKLATFLYGGYNEEIQNIGGASFNSEYRIGLQVSRDCLITIVNEPKACFSNENTIETVKNAVELLICRKVQGKIYPALSPVIFTSNGFVPDMDSLYRRLYIIEFTHDQRKVGEVRTQFEDIFHVEQPQRSCLQALNVLGRICLREVMLNPELLEEDWMDLAKYFVNRWYEIADKALPMWIMGWSEDADVSEVDEEIIENVRSLLMKTISDDMKFNSDYSSETYVDKVRSSKDFLNPFWVMLNKQVFNWAVPHSPYGKKLIFLNQGFKNLLKREIDDISTLKGAATLLGWEYKKRNIKGKTRRGIVISVEDFLEFVYPTIEEIEEEEEEVL